MPPDYWKIGKKQHFICSNLTLCIVPFFLFSLFVLFYSLFFFFSFFLSPWGRGRRRPPAPPQMTPLLKSKDSLCSGGGSCQTCMVTMHSFEHAWWRRRELTTTTTWLHFKLCLKQFNNWSPGGNNNIWYMTRGCQTEPGGCSSGGGIDKCVDVCSDADLCNDINYAPEPLPSTTTIITTTTTGQSLHNRMFSLLVVRISQVSK